MTNFRRRRAKRGDQHGFTLIELVIVVVIIARKTITPPSKWCSQAQLAMLPAA